MKNILFVVLATGFFTLTSFALKAQCEDALPSNYYPVTAQALETQTSGALLILGFENADQVKFPVYYQLKNANKETIKEGVIESNKSYAGKGIENPLVQFNQLSFGEYSLTFCDNSSVPLSIKHKYFIGK